MEPDNDLIPDEFDFDYDQPGPELEENPSSKSKNGLWAVLGILLAALLKFKTVILLGLSKFKFLLVLLKLSKFAGTLISMLVTVWIYALRYTWSFAIGFVILILVHEMGHYLEAKHLGLNVSAPLFIPFVGAFINMREQPHDAVMEAKVGLSGPVLGSFAAALCAIYGFYGGSGLALSLAYVGFMLNLFNLIPVGQLDGGRTAAAISPKLWLIGIPILGYFSIRYLNPILILILCMAIYQAYQVWKSGDQNYYDTPAETRFKFAVIYFGLIAMLGFGLFYIHGMEQQNQVISLAISHFIG